VKLIDLRCKFGSRITQKGLVNHDIWFRIILDKNKGILVSKFGCIGN